MRAKLARADAAGQKGGAGGGKGGPAIVRLLRDWRTDLVVLSVGAGFGAFTGLSYWAPALIEDGGVWSPAASALFATIPQALGIPVSIGYAAFADRRGNHLRWASLGMVVILIGVLASAAAVATPNERRYTPLLIGTLSINVFGFSMWCVAHIASPRPGTR